MDLEPIFLSFRLAAITTIILLILAIPLAYWISYGRFRLKPVVEALVSMPLVLPPTVLGFYLMLAFSPNSGFGQFLDQKLNLRLVFTFEGLIVASIIYSLPFMLHPILSGFRSLPIHLKEASYTLGKSRIRTLFSVLLPNIKASMLTGIVLSFAHTIGEFGVVLMIGGSIPGQTRVASIAIYDEVEAMRYASANQYALILFVITFMILLAVYLINKKIVAIPGRND
jgi:molybdate transport system permease protein